MTRISRDSKKGLPALKKNLLPLIIVGIMLTILSIPSSLHAASLRVYTNPNTFTHLGDGLYSTTVEINADATDANLMFYGIDMEYSASRLSFDTSNVVRADFYTEGINEQSDTFFVRVLDNPSAGTASLLGCRMVANPAQKGLTGSEIPLLAEIRFKVTGASLPDAVTLKNFRFRDAAGALITPEMPELTIAFQLSQDGTLTTIIRAEGRAANNNGGIQVTLVEQQGATYTAATANNGMVSFADLPDGTYYLLAEDPSTLDTVITGILVQDGEVSNVPAQVDPLLLGDVNGDNVINDFDRSAFTSLYLANQGSASTPETLAADVNRDGLINSDDLNLVLELGGNNFGRTGSVTPW